MPAYTTVVTHATGDVLPATDWNTYLRDNLAFLHDQGADLSGATITPTSQFHRVTGTTTITSIAAPSGTGQGGNRLTLKFQSAGCAITSGAALVLTQPFTSLANQSISFVWDSTLAGWVETGRSGSGMTLIQDTAVGVDAASVSFQNIPQTFVHLLLIGSARTSAALATDSIYARVNNISTSTYDTHRLSAVNTTVTSAPGAAGAQGYALEAVPGNTAAANLFGAGILFFPNYAQTANRMMWIGFDGTHDTESATFTNWELDFHFSKQRSNAAISRIDLAATASAGNIKAGSRFTLYGI